MDINAYIASGKLEQYVLGLLTATEEAEVEAMAAEHPAIRKELTAIEEALATYAQSQAVAMPAGLPGKIEARILREIASESEHGRGKALPWALVLIALLAAAAAFWFWRQNEASQGTSEQLRTVLAEVQDNCDEQAARLEAAEQQLGILRNPAFRPIIMAGTELAPTATATVYYNPEARQAYLDAGTLPATPSDKQYQLWAIVDGTPVSIGLFDALGQLATWQEVNFADNPQLFAVTLEPRGGSESPTLDAMYVAGEVL